MKIRFIRHGDPDYGNDTLTEKKKRGHSFWQKQRTALRLFPPQLQRLLLKKGNRGLHIFGGFAWETVLICMRETRSHPLHADLRAVWK